ncbi:MAG: hypothetical protein ACLQT7_04785 [Candidatus Dormibacteria bacterium]
MFGRDRLTEDEANAEVRQMAERRAAMARQVDPTVAYWRQQRADWEADQAAFQVRQAAAAAKATEEHEARRRAQIEAETERQRRWAARRTELADAVRRLRAEVAQRQAIVDTGDLTNAAAALAERNLLAERLNAAEAAYTQHHLTAGLKLTAVPSIR